MPIEVDNDPQEEDIAKFGSDSAMCPKCKATIYDDAEWCHKCGTVLGGEDTKPRAPLWLIITALALIGVFVLTMKFW